MQPFLSLLPSLLLVFLTGCDETTAPSTGPDPVPLPTGNHTFTFLPPAGAPPVNTVGVRGSFNNWDVTAMQRQTDGSWRIPAELPDGDTQYKFFINGSWVDDMCYDRTWGDPALSYVVDPDAAGCVSDGFEGRNAVVSRGDVSLDFRHSATSVADVSVAGGRLSVRLHVRSEQITEAQMIVGTDTLPMHIQFADGLEETWRGTTDRSVSNYTLRVAGPDTAATFGPYDVPANLFASVEWVESAVGYQIFPERFWNGDPTNDSLPLTTDEYYFRDAALESTEPEITSNWSGGVGDSHCCHQYFGGDLQGIIDRLGDLEDRGVTVLYLNPIFTAGSAHGYDTFDYRRVAPAFGDSAVLRTLVDEAHARGMRLIWDYVPNHVGIGHWAFQDAIANGEASDYWDWFNFRVPADSIQAGNGEHYDAWWGFGSLPELQTRNAEVMEHLLDVAVGWTEFGFDGIRVDVPNELDNRSTFFPAWRDAVKAVDPEVYLVGEIWERDPTWLRGNQFDALMNYALSQGAVEPFARGDIPGPVAASEMAEHFSAYSEATVAMSFNLLASHDTDRLLTKMGGGELFGAADDESRARHQLAAAVLFAMPGMPVTFQGDECAFLGGSAGRHTARYPMQWDRCDTEFVAHYATLAELKRTTPALTSPAIRGYPGSGGLLAFLRGEPGDGELLAVFNNTASGETLSLPEGSWRDLDTAEAFSASATVAGFGWRYLVRE